MSDAPLMLGVSGLRGIVGESLTPEVAIRYASAFGIWLQSSGGGGWDPSIIVGRDGRLGGDMLMRAAIAGLQSVGCHVIDIGVATTPTHGVMVDHVNEASGALIVTASHNPQEWNGLKCLVGRREPHDSEDWISASAPAAAQAAEIIQLYLSRSFELRTQYTAWPPKTDTGAAAIHVRSVRSCLGDLIELDPSRLLPMRCVVDSVNCSGSHVAVPFLSGLVAGFTQIHGLESGEFPHNPEPTLANLSGPGGLCDAVPGLRADIGFAQDPDADRLAIVDERGEYIGEEYTLALAAEALLGAPPLRGGSE